MTFKELVQSKLPTRLLGARIEKVEPLGYTAAVRVYVAGDNPFVITAKEMVEAKVHLAAPSEKWGKVVAEVMSLELPPDLPPPERPATATEMAERAQNAQLEMARPNPWLTFADIQKLEQHRRDNAEHFKAEYLCDWPAQNRLVELEINALRKTMRAIVDRGLTEDGQMIFDCGTSREGYMRVHFRDAKVAYLCAKMYPGPIREGWLVATPFGDGTLRDAVEDGVSLTWALTVGQLPPRPYGKSPAPELIGLRGIDVTTYPQWKVGIENAQTNVEQAMLKMWQKFMSRCVYDAYLIPDEIIDADGHWNPGKMARIANVDVPVNNADPVKVDLPHYLPADPLAPIKEMPRLGLLARVKLFLDELRSLRSMSYFTAVRGAENLSDQIEEVLAQRAPKPAPDDKPLGKCPHFKDVDYSPGYSFHDRGEVPPHRTVNYSAVRDPDDCPHCLQERIKKLRGALETALTALSSTSRHCRTVDAVRGADEALKVLYADYRDHPRPWR